MQTDKELKFTISPDVLYQEVSGESVLLDLASENYFGLDAIGTRIWALLDSGANLGDVLRALEEEYEVDRETLESDVSELLDKLLEAGLVKN